MQKKFAIVMVIALVIVAAVAFLMLNKPTPIKHYDFPVAEWTVIDTQEREIGKINAPVILPLDNQEACIVGKQAAIILNISNFECFRIEDPQSSIMPGQWVVYSQASPPSGDVGITIQYYVALDENTSIARGGIIT